MRQRGGRVSGSVLSAESVRLPAQVVRLLRVRQHLSGIKVRISSFWAGRFLEIGLCGSRQFGAGLCTHPGVSCSGFGPQARLLLCAHAERVIQRLACRWGRENIWRV